MDMIFICVGVGGFDIYLGRYGWVGYFMGGCGWE